MAIIATISRSHPARTYLEAANAWLVVCLHLRDLPALKGILWPNAANVGEMGRMRGVLGACSGRTRGNSGTGAAIRAPPRTGQNARMTGQNARMPECLNLKPPLSQTRGVFPVIPSTLSQSRTATFSISKPIPCPYRALCPKAS